MLRTAPFANHTSLELAPGPTVDSPQALGAWLRKPGHFATAHNWCGSARMGPPSDASSVLDERLQVKGVQDLRVVDSSALPGLP